MKAVKIGLLILIFVVVAWLGYEWRSSAIIIFCAIVLAVGVSVGPEVLTRLLTEGLRAWLKKHGVSDEIVEEVTGEILRRFGGGKEPLPPKQGTQIKVNSKSRVAYEDGIRALNNGKLDEAIAQLEEAARIDKHNWLATQMLGALYLNFKDDAKQSLKYSLLAIAVDKHHYNQLMNAGVAYLWLNEYAKAREHLDLAIKSLEGDPIARHIPAFVTQYGKCLMFLGEAFAKEGNKTKASEYYDLAVQKFEEVPKQYRDVELTEWLSSAEKGRRES